MNGFRPYEIAPTKKAALPWFEDSQELKIPGRRTDKPIERLQKEISDLMGDLGARRIRFTAGTYEGVPKRHGFVVEYELEGVPGRLDIAALPLRLETPTKLEQAKAQALFLVRHWLEAEKWSSVYRPGSVPLVEFLLPDPNDGRTVTQMIVERVETLPRLLPGGGA